MNLARLPDRPQNTEGAVPGKPLLQAADQNASSPHSLRKESTAREGTRFLSSPGGRVPQRPSLQRLSPQRPSPTEAEPMEAESLEAESAGTTLPPTVRGP